MRNSLKHSELRRSVLERGQIAFPHAMAFDGSDLTTAERAFIMHLREKKIPLREAAKAAETTARKSVPLLRALNEYLRTQTGNSKSHTQSLKNYYTRFSRDFPHRDVAEITSADIAGYLFAHKSNERQIYGRLRQFFRWCVMMDYIERNPIERVPKPDPDNKERQVLTPDQMRALLKAASGTPVVLRYLVLGGFFGLRPSEVEKLRCEDIDLEHAEIHVRNMKTSKRGLRERYVSASPDAIPNGCAWLEALRLPAKGRVAWRAMSFLDRSSFFAASVKRTSSSLGKRTERTECVCFFIADRLNFIDAFATFSSTSDMRPDGYLRSGSICFCMSAALFSAASTDPDFTFPPRVYPI